jgi:hypothetical protein
MTGCNSLYPTPVRTGLCARAYSCGKPARLRPPEAIMGHLMGPQSPGVLGRAATVQ